MNTGIRATEKQMKLAKWISDVLDIQLPEKNSIGAYSAFISAHKKSFDDKLYEIRTARDSCGFDRSDSEYGVCDALEEYF